MGEQAPSEKGSVNEEEVQAWVDSRQFFSLSPSLSFFFFWWRRNKHVLKKEKDDEKEDEDEGGGAQTEKPRWKEAHKGLQTFLRLTHWLKF